MIRLVEDWKLAGKWISMRLILLAAGIVEAWAWLPEEYRAMVPKPMVEHGVVFVLLAAGLGRVIKQPLPPPDQK